MAENLENEAPKPKKRQKLVIPWRVLAIYILPALVIFIIFFVMHNSLVKAPLSREEIKNLLENKQKETPLKTNPEEARDPIETSEEKLPQGSNIPFIGPQHFYHSFT